MNPLFHDQKERKGPCLNICFISSRSSGHYAAFVEEKHIIGIEHRNGKSMHSHFFCEEFHVDKEYKYRIIGEYVFTGDFYECRNGLFVNDAGKKVERSVRLIPDNVDAHNKIMAKSPSLLAPSTNA
jgi:hypothetical protein